MTFSERLYEKLQPVWRKNHSHPFVQGLGDGSLDPEKFRFFMIQDYIFLIEYSRLFAIGAMKAKDVKTMGIFSKILDSTLNEEMALHRRYAAKFHISEEELANASPSPTTLAYTHYMLHTGQNGTLAHLLSALLPCMWSYREIGTELNEIPGAADHELYGEWIAMYSSAEFGELAQWCIELLDEVTAGKPDSELEELEEIFLNTTRFEYMFWEMSYSEAMWPIDA